MMKLKFNILLVFVLILSFMSAYAPNMWEGYSFDHIQKRLRQQYLVDQEIKFWENLRSFKADLALRESNNNWKTYNPYGYIGKFQFGEAALELTGYGHVSFVEFMNNPAVFPEHEQEKAMDRLLKINSYILNPYIKKYVGEFLGDSIIITKTGLLAAAHLAGPGNVIKYLETQGQHNPVDQMGTYLSDYLTTFAANFQ